MTTRTKVIVVAVAVVLLGGVAVGYTTLASRNNTGDSAAAADVDDQAIWLDNNTVGYSLQRPDGINDTWIVPANGSGTPSLLTPDAGSPAMLN